MSVDQQLLEKLRALTPEKQEEVLKFLDSLIKAGSGEKPRHSLLGLWSDLNIHITAEDVAESRREMWGNFPRDIEL